MCGIFVASGETSQRSKDVVLGNFIIFKDKSIRMTCFVNLTIIYKDRNDLLDVVSKLTVGTLSDG